MLLSKNSGENGRLSRDSQEEKVAGSGMVKLGVLRPVRLGTLGEQPHLRLLLRYGIDKGAEAAGPGRSRKE
ncbi:MAG: hypothetical protein NWR72_02460, partial [Bacteroidia bacterium]|nr:hypothetical protein [Bacteroidia bacterium]